MLSHIENQKVSPTGGDLEGAKKSLFAIADRLS